MVVAIRQSDNKAVIGALIQKDQTAIYHCDYCKNVVIHHKSESGEKVGHFKHKPGESHCPNLVKETEEHIRTKLDIYEYIKDGWGSKLKVLEVEKWICDNTIRPDVYIETSRNKIAIEVQATALTVDEIKRRTSRYYKNGIAVLWIMPYYHRRFMEYKYQVEGYNEEECDFGWSYMQSVKLKSMELFLLWAYFKNLYFWEYERVFSNGFIQVQLEKYVGEDVEFRRDGEDHYYTGKTAKTVKIVKSIRFNISFDEFRVTQAREYDVKQSNYSVPARILFEARKKN
jgi:competence CoiA-like predicted nuclease